MKNNVFKTIEIYWSHIRHHWLIFFSVIFLVATGSVVSSVIPLYLKKIVDAISSGGPAETMFGVALGVLLTIGILAFTRWACFRGSGFLYVNFSSRMLAELSDFCFEHLHKHSFSFFSDNFSGSLVKKVNYFVRGFDNILDTFVWSLLQMFVYLVIIIGVLIYRDLFLGLATLIWLVAFFITNFIFSTWKYKYDVSANEAMSKTTGFLADTISNFSSLKLFNGYKREVKGYATLNEEVRKKNLFTWNLGESFNATTSFFMLVLQVGLLWISIYLWREGKFTAGDFVLVQSYVLIIIDQAWQFSHIVRNFYRSFSDAEEMTVLLETTPEILDIPTAKKMIVKEGRIEFKRVEFCYHKTRKVLDNFNMVIQAREKVALIGPSGAGKTTVVKLLLRNFDLTAGEILIDGQNIAKVTQESLWKNISLVPQDPALFHRTLKENIRYGRPEATDEEVIKASKLAHCHEFISRLPEKYETYVGERGIKLSGGERQRVAIARAILRNAPILILDEATSSLDSESENLIQDALEKLMQDKTVMVIAHRLSTIREMNRIIFIDEGEIKEEGTHEQLENKAGGMYRKLWEIQAGGFVK